MKSFALVAVWCAISTTVLGQKCEQGKNCQLPDCFCPTTKHFLGAHNIPQIVYFGYDDAVQPQVSGYYEQIFTKDTKNPNGCPITMSLYISNQYTVYGMVADFFKKGDETADHSVTHTDIDAGDKLRREASEQKENLIKKAGIPANDIIGWRSPNLKTAGDAQPRVLKELNFTYDISLTYDGGSSYTFPFTLDYGYPYPCKIEPCPTSKHPGFWEVMVHSLINPVTGEPCAYVDSCRPDGEDAAFEYLWKNFEKTYGSERAPFGLNMHAAWYAFPGYLDATRRFIKKLLETPDVYIVSVKQMMEWMKNPVEVSKINEFEPWGCGNIPTTKTTTTSTTTTSTTTTTTTTTSTTTKTPKTTRTTTTTHPTTPMTTTTIPLVPTFAPAPIYTHNLPKPARNEIPLYNWLLQQRTPKPSIATHTPAIATTTEQSRDKIRNQAVLFWETYLKRGDDNNNVGQSASSTHCLQGVNCHLPSCFCKTSGPLKGISSSDTPQIIYLTIDSKVDGRSFSSLMQLFSGSLRNRDGCSISASIFIPPSGNYPPYVKVLKQSGIHVALNSRYYSNYMSRDLVKMTMNRALLQNKGMLSPKLGWRALGHLPPPDFVLKTLQDRHVLFDSSVINNDTRVTWPYTLDFGIENACPSTSSLCHKYPGMWEVALQQLLIPDTTRTCLFLDSCPSQYSVEELLMYNFNRHYTNGRVPLGINLGDQWLLNSRNGGIRGLFHFLENILRTRNVMVVSIDKMLQWVASPEKMNRSWTSC